MRTQVGKHGQHLLNALCFHFESILDAELR
jgi:hypothetical protein